MVTIQTVQYHNMFYSFKLNRAKCNNKPLTNMSNKKGALTEEAWTKGAVIVLPKKMV